MIICHCHPAATLLPSPFSSYTPAYRPPHAFLTHPPSTLALAPPTPPPPPTPTPTRTQYGGLRPFGVSLLYAGWDKTWGFQLYASDPSGNYGGWKATSIGANSVAAQSLMKQEYKADAISLDDALKLAIKVRAHTLPPSYHPPTTLREIDRCTDEANPMCRQERGWCPDELRLRQHCARMGRAQEVWVGALRGRGTHAA